MEEGGEAGDGLFATQCDTSVALEAFEEALDEVAFLAEHPVGVWLVGPRRVGLDLRSCAEFVEDEGSQPVRVVGGIGDDVRDPPLFRQPVE